jgi:hypothetical protein
MSCLIPGTDMDREQEQAQVNQAPKHSFDDVTPFYTGVNGQL